ncbi:MAG: helix-hairpin-helix domain-containing protein [Deltaproteobacteria bacterium]|nr:helix-hairpin-helix domain-containing protein [Deltaproteobacteria bacterium]
MPDEGSDNVRTEACSAKMRVQASVANVAFCFGAVLLLMTTGGGSGSDQASCVCEFPHEVASEEGWTTDVGCDGTEGADDRQLRGPVRLLFGLTLDLNRADEQALEVLPRIGPRRAAAIVHAREEAAFTSVAELARVRGIGAKTIEGLSGWVGVGGSE